MFRRVIASVVAAALILVAPGLPAWAGAGQAVSSGRGSAPAPVPSVTVNVVPAGANLGAGLNLGASFSNLPAVNIPTLPGSAPVGQSQSAAAQNSAALPISQQSVSGQLTPSARSAQTQGLVPSVVNGAPVQAVDAKNAVNPSVLPTSARTAAEAFRQNDPTVGLDRAFENSRSLGDNASPNVAEDGGLPAAARAPLDASAPQAAASEPPAPPTPPSANDGGGPGGPGGPKKPSLTLVLFLGAAAGVGAFFALPLVIGWAAPLLPAWAIANILAVKIGVVAAGSLIGVSASQWPTWAGFPRATYDAAREAGKTAFRFWARFGRVFHNVLTGGSADEAMKADLPANVFKYPVGAMIFVAIGYVFYPLVATLGILYKVVATPIAGAWRGVKQIAVEFVPWLVDFLENLIPYMKKAVSFLAGLVSGLVVGALAPVVIGAAFAGAPLATRVLVQGYKPESGAGWIGVFVARVAAVAGILVAGAVGAVVALPAAILFAPTMAAYMALKFAGSKSRARLSLEDWFKRLGEEEGQELLTDFDLGPSSRNIPVAEGLARLVNLVPLSVPASFATLIWGLSAYVRAWQGAPVARFDAKIEPAAVLEVPAREPGLAGYGKSVVAAAKGTSALSWRLWRSAGLRADAAIMRRAPVASLKDASVFAWPAAAGGALAVVPAYLGGGLYQALVVPARAAWRNLVKLALKIWPALKSFFRFLKNVIVRFIPFVFGFAFGTIAGLVEGAFVSGAFSIRPFFRIYDSDVSLRGWAQWRYGAALVLLAIPLVAVGVLNAAVGLVVSIPYALVRGLGLATRWSRASEKGARVFREWRDNALEARAERAAELNKDLAPIESNLTGWNALVAGMSATAHGLVSFVTFAPAFGRAAVEAMGDAVSYVNTGNRPDLGREPSSTEPRLEAPVAKPWTSPHYAVAFVGMVGGATAAVVASAFFGLPALLGLAGWLGYASFAGAGLLGALTGAALSQPSFWTQIIPEAVGRANAAGGVAWSYWSRAGAAFAGGVKGTGREAQSKSILGYGHRAIGALAAAVSALAGLAVGAAWVSLRAAGTGSWQVISEFLPTLKKLVLLAKRIVWKIVPFVFGLGAGFVMGVAGSMLFGVLLLSRPYFKHVVAADFEYSGLGGFLHNAGLKLVALVAGVIMGALGLVVGLIVALPYAITLIPSTAFQLAEIGGGSQKFFDLWSKGTLRAELRRVNALTNKFEFPDDGRTQPLINGWLRLANIVPATIAATIAGAIAGWVSYFRSIINAAKALKRGDAVPTEGFDSMWSVSKAAGKGAKWGAKLGGPAGFIWAAFFGGAALIGMAGLSGFLVFWTGMWLAGLLGGLVLGTFLGLVSWLARQLEK